MQTIEEKTRQTPVLAETDVAVAGGGIAGCLAAVSAARLGAKVTLIERYGYLGGVTTGWPVRAIWQLGRPHSPLVLGLGKELIDRLAAAGGWIDHTTSRGTSDGEIDTELCKLVLVEMLDEAGVEILLHAWTADAVQEDGRVAGVIVESKSGRGAVLSKATIDATGDGDVAAFAGARYLTRNDYEQVETQHGKGKIFHSFGADLLDVDHGRLQAFKHDEPERFAKLMAQAELPPVDDGVRVMYRLQGDACDLRDLTRMELECSRRLLASVRFARNHIPGYENVHVRIAPQFGVREGRRILGKYYMTKNDLDEEKTFPDSVCRFYNYGHDMHSGLPYRCMVPETIDGLIIGTRSMSVDAKVFDMIRLIGTAFAIGHAAGVAAGLCAVNDVQPRQLDPQLLQKTLIEQGALI